MNKGKYYITTAIAYTSRVPHIGNTYEAVLADAIARYKRLTGYDVFFMTGTDEHGKKIQQQAEAEGVTPQAHVDHIAGEIRRIWDMMNVSYDKFIRTTDSFHEKSVSEIFKKLYEQGDIYKSKYTGHYCVACESFYTDAQLNGGKCPDCGGPVEPASEEAYFLRLSKYADRLIRHIEDNPDFIQPKARRNEMVNNFLKPGLLDLCVSRSSFTWGIPVEFDPGHVIYVWIDALSNYITGLGYRPGEKSEMYEKYWPADIHLIGKDILRFHTIYWPIILMALGEPLPKKIFGHPWLLMGGEKMSKSKGNVIYADDLVKYFGVDAVRYFVLNEMPFASDGSLTYELVAARYNSDLANILGNLVNRTMAMTGKYFGGIAPACGELTEVDLDLRSTAQKTVEAVEAAMNELRVADALGEIWTLLRRSNRYIDETEPWLLAKDEAKRERLGTVLYHLLESIRIAAVLLQAFLPETAERIFRQLNTEETVYESVLAFGGLRSGRPLGVSEVLFARLDEKALMEQIEKEHASAEAPKREYAPLAEEISIDGFGAVDLRAARVLACEPVKKSAKLLKLTVDLGFEQRQVVSGIAKWYQPADMIGKTVVLVANLKPAKLCGVESQGMILACDGSDDSAQVVFLPDGTEPGSKIR
ncbi:MAG: methionine--tRNA ligase [Clostridiales bacterium]|nr:MAG: methionine--tRNA ligase [Clostridiales bacterium]